MDTAIVVALITAGASLVASAWTVGRQNRSKRDVTELQHRLDEEAREHEREIAAKEHLDRYREPLLALATLLLSRIGNIRKNNFLGEYLRGQDDRRRRLALLSTLYRMGQYWT